MSPVAETTHTVALCIVRVDGHAHTAHCWWHPHQARWVCRHHRTRSTTATDTTTATD